MGTLFPFIPRGTRQLRPFHQRKGSLRLTTRINSMNQKSSEQNQIETNRRNSRLLNGAGCEPIIQSARFFNPTTKVPPVVPEFVHRGACSTISNPCYLKLNAEQHSRVQVGLPKI